MMSAVSLARSSVLTCRRTCTHQARLWASGPARDCIGRKPRRKYTKLRPVQHPKTRVMSTSRSRALQTSKTWIPLTCVSRPGVDSGPCSSSAIRLPVASACRRPSSVRFCAASSCGYLSSRSIPMGGRKCTTGERCTCRPNGESPERAVMHERPTCRPREMKNQRNTSTMQHARFSRQRKESEMPGVAEVRHDRPLAPRHTKPH